MKRSNRVKWGELKVGLLIVFAIVALIWASLTGGGTSIFDRKVVYSAYFNNVNGLVSGAPVWLSGVEVGNVKSIKFVSLDAQKQIEIKFRVKRSVKNMITTDAKVRLGTIGLLGDKYIEVVPGTLTLPEIEEGGVVETATTGDLSAIMSQGEEMMGSTNRLMTNLTEITEKIKRGEGFAGQLFINDLLYTEMTDLTTSLTVLVNGLQENQKKITRAIENMSTDISHVTSKVDNNAGTLGKLIGEPGLYDNLHSSTGRIDSILNKINSGSGTAGAMINDDELYQDIRNLIVRVENLVADIEKNPRKYFKISVF